MLTDKLTVDNNKKSWVQRAICKAQKKCIITWAFQVKKNSMNLLADKYEK